MIMQKYNHLKSILHSYSEIFFIKETYIGAIILIATFISPNVGIAGILSLLSSYLFARFLNIGKEFLETGFYTYNSLLVGLSIGYLFKITVLTIFFTFIAGILTLVFSIMLYNLFSYYLKLPILSIPFVFISSILYLAVSNYSNLFVSSLYPHMNFLFLENIIPVWLAGYFKSLGTILFLPNILAGFLFSILIFIFSRILFMLSIIGYYVGSISIGFLTGSFIQSFSDINHFNFILISMALGGVFLIPSIKSYIIAIIAVITSTIVLSSVKTFWAFYSIPVFTLPFNFITLTFLYVLGLLSFPYIAKYIRKNPEESLDYFITIQKRFTGTYYGIHLPFSGKWTVWQGFDGEWTHKGSWKYAFDFVIKDKNGKTYINDGLNLDDYYAYKKPVLSPVRGRVINVVSDLPDNPIGVVDKENNWGNYIIIQDVRGFYVEISHLAQNSIKVKAGDWVEIGTFLGLCGNSGYSPQPHIHIQVQLYETLGSQTTPFSFVNYISNNKFFSNHIPKENETLQPVYPDKAISNKLSFYLDNEFTYEVFKENIKIDEFSIKVKMETDGTFYFSSEKGKLYFGKQDGTFYFYRLDGDDEYLKLMFLSAPKIPLINDKTVYWNDYLPSKVALKQYLKDLVLFISSFNHSFYEIRYKGKFKSSNEIIGNIKGTFIKNTYETYMKIDDILGFKEIKIKNITIKLKNTNFGG